MGVWTLLLVGLLVAGCGGDSASAATLKGNVVYGKSGGIAGIVQKLTVEPSGRAIAASAQQKRSFKLTQGELRRLGAAVAKADLARTKSPKDDGQGADGFTYGVTYRKDRVTWTDFSAEPPQRVLTLYRLLDDLYERHSPCPPDGRSC